MGVYITVVAEGELLLKDMFIGVHSEMPTHVQSSGKFSKGVPGVMPLSGSPIAGS